MMLAILLAAIVFFLLPKTNADPDLGWHLSNAQYFFRHHAFLRTDIYSFTVAGKRWIDPEWLAEMPFYLGWRWLGERGIFLVTYLALATILLGIFGLATIQSRNPKAAFLVSLPAIAFASVSFGPRTLLFGWIFLVVEFAVLHCFRHAPGWIWLLPPLFLTWGNTHGSWLIGFVVLGMFSLSGCIEGQWGAIVAKRWTLPQARRLAWVSVLSLAVLFVNPYGWRLVVYPFNLAFHQRLNIASIVEWGSLDFHSLRGKVALATLAISIVVRLACHRRWMLDELAFLLLGIYAGFTYSRFLFLAAILIVPFLAKDLRRSIPQYEAARDRPRLNAAIMLLCVLAVWRSFPTNQQLVSAESAQYPIAATAFLAGFHPKGNVLNDYLWGGHLIWNEPQIPVFVDSRVDIFEEHGIFRDYLRLAHLQGTFGVLKKYNIRYVLVRESSPVAYLLENSREWKVDYRDTTTVLFERVSAVATHIQSP